MNILLLYIMLQVHPKHYFRHYENTCYATTYVIEKEWNLFLNEDATFYLKFSNHDSRKKKQIIEYSGTWVNKNDTITLTVPAPGFVCYFERARYLQSNGRLKLISSVNDCLPRRFE